MALRPPTPEDAQAVFEVMVARDVADIGHPDVALDDVLEEWQAPGVDPARDCFVAVDGGGTIVGYASIEPRGAMVLVPPGEEGRGYGRDLREAVERRAAERGEPVRQVVQPANAASVAHLQAVGYQRLYVYQRMRA